MKNIEIIMHQTELPSDDYVKSLMGRRVRQGYPNELAIKINDELCTAYEWTDGIEDILSVFVFQKQGTIKEIVVLR